MIKFKPVTIEEVNIIWGNANFGPNLNNRKMDVVKGALLKWACKYSTGHTAFMLLVNLGLMTEKKNITIRGRRQLWEFFKQSYPSV